MLTKEDILLKHCDGEALGRHPSDYTYCEIDGAIDGKTEHVLAAMEEYAQEVRNSFRETQEARFRLRRYEAIKFAERLLYERWLPPSEDYDLPKDPKWGKHFVVRLEGMTFDTLDWREFSSEELYDQFRQEYLDLVAKVLDEDI